MTDDKRDDDKRRVAELRFYSERNGRRGHEGVFDLLRILDAETKRADEAEQQQRLTHQNACDYAARLKRERDTAIKRAEEAESWQSKVIADRDAVVQHLVKRLEAERDEAVKRADKEEQSATRWSKIYGDVYEEKAVLRRERSARLDAVRAEIDAAHAEIDVLAVLNGSPLCDRIAQLVRNLRRRDETISRLEAERLTVRATVGGEQREEPIGPLTSLLISELRAERDDARTYVERLRAAGNVMRDTADESARYLTIEDGVLREAIATWDRVRGPE